MYVDSRQVVCLILREAQRNRIVLDLGDGPDRARDLALSPQVTSLEDEVRDMSAVDHEAVDLAEEMVIRRGDRARAPDLDLSLGYAVKNDACIFDADVPVRIARGGLAESKKGELLNVFELAGLLCGATQIDLPGVVVVGFDQLDGNEPGNVVSLLRLDDQMR